MLCRAAANLMQRLCKPNAERQACLIVMLRCRQSYANTLPTSAKRALLSICRVQLSVMQRYIFSPTPPSISQILRYILPLMINFILPQIPPMDTDLFLRIIVLSRGKQSSPPYHTHFKILTNHFSSHRQISWIILMRDCANRPTDN